MKATRYHIVCDQEDIRLDVFLSEKLLITRTKVKDMVGDGHIRVNGKIPKASLKIKKAMEIEGVIPEEEPLSLVPENIPLDVLYEDEYFLAINKPADMVVHPSFGHSSGTLVNAVLSYLKQPGIGHRAQSMEHGKRVPESLRKNNLESPAVAPEDGRWDENTSIFHLPSGSMPMECALVLSTDLIRVRPASYSLPKIQKHRRCFRTFSRSEA
jgi:23S rRNA pseudouridine1911/1915/1917 synthase